MHAYSAHSVAMRAHGLYMVPYVQKYSTDLLMHVGTLVTVHGNTHGLCMHIYVVNI